MKIVIFFIILLSVKPSAVGELLFFCASGHRKPIEEIIRNYEKESGEKIRAAFGASGALLSQMIIAKKGCLYLSASDDFIKKAYEKGVLDELNSFTVAYQLPAVVVSNKNKKLKTLEDLAEFRVKIAIPNPLTAPAGLYAFEFLKKNGLLESFRPNIVVLTANVEEAFAHVVMGSVDAAFVWNTTAAGRDEGVRTLDLGDYKIPRIAKSEICIPIYAKDRNKSEALLKYILSPSGRVVFEKYGFITDKNIALKKAPGAKLGGGYKLPEGALHNLGRRR